MTSSRRILIGYPNFISPEYGDVEKMEQHHFSNLIKAGFDVEGFCLTLHPPAQRLSFKQLDSLWKKGDYGLMKLYERLEQKLAGKDIFINGSGINLHPDFVQKLNVFTVFSCFDDPESSADLSHPVAWAYDLSLVGNIAEVDTYKSWGVKNVEWTTQYISQELFNPKINVTNILNGKRDIDIFMMSDKTSHWRTARLQALADAFPNGNFYGKGWPRGYLPGSQQLKYLSRTKIGPNIHNSTGPINLRTFYLPANGVLQICDNKSHLSKLFKLNEEAVGFETISECIDLCRYYLDHDQERREIAARGWQRAVKDYNEIAVFERTMTVIEKYYKTKKTPATYLPSIALQHRQKVWPRRMVSEIYLKTIYPFIKHVR